VPMSNADRQRLWRERQGELRREQEQAAAKEDAYARYLRDAEAGARFAASQRNEDGRRTEERVARAVRYAKWRREGYHAGDVAAL